MSMKRLLSSSIGAIMCASAALIFATVAVANTIHYRLSHGVDLMLRYLGAADPRPFLARFGILRAPLDLTPNHQSSPSPAAYREQNSSFFSRGSGGRHERLLIGGAAA